MNIPTPEFRFLVPLVVAIVGVSAYLRPVTWYLSPALLLAFMGVYGITRTWHDRGFYLVCSGVLLTAATGSLNIWVGLVTLWMVAGTVCSSHGLLRNTHDMGYFLLFCGTTAALALLIAVSNHVVIPVVILLAGSTVLLLVQSVRRYQFKKHYSGGDSQ